MAVLDVDDMIFGAGHGLGLDNRRVLDFEATVFAEVIVTTRLATVVVPVRTIERLHTAIALQIRTRDYMASDYSLDL
jgi:hypothetical protein